jgi:cytochrome c biogenesis protein CcdA
MVILLLFSFLAGIGTMLSPCIAPILPIILAAGTSKGKWRPLGICLGLVTSFTVFTVALTSIVHVIGIMPTQLRFLAIGLVFAFGFFMLIPKLSAMVYDLLSPVARIGEYLQQKRMGEGFLGGLALGIALGLLWTPCAGPILGAITTLIATQSISFSTVLLAFTYVLGASIPLFVIVWGSGKAIRSSSFLSRHAEGIRQTLGGVTVLVALNLSFGF